MTTPELTKWLRGNSAGDYRPAADAADLIDRLVAVLREAVGCSDAMKLASTHPALTKEGASAWRMAGEELESAIKAALPDYDRVCREVHEANVKELATPLRGDAETEKNHE